MKGNNFEGLVFLKEVPGQPDTGRSFFTMFGDAFRVQHIFVVSEHLLMVARCMLMPKARAQTNELQIRSAPGFLF